MTRTPEFTNINPLETNNLVFYPCPVVEGWAKGIVVKMGDNTTMGRIMNLAGSLMICNSTPFEKEIEHFVRNLAIIAALIGVCFLFIAFVLGYNWIDALIIINAIILANIPDCLLITFTVCLSLGSETIFRQNCLLRNRETLETLDSSYCLSFSRIGDDLPPKLSFEKPG